MSITLLQCKSKQSILTLDISQTVVIFCFCMLYMQHNTDRAN